MSQESDKKPENIRGHGFIGDIIEDDNYVLGGFQLPTEILQPTGQWRDFLPGIEFQKKNGLETMNCTGYGTTNAIEILFKRLYGESKDYSERYVGVMSETKKRGNSPHKVAEVIRKISGLINDELLPFHENIKSWEEYYFPNPMKEYYLNIGKAWLRNYEFGHEWVFKGEDSSKPEKIKEALKYSPVAVSLHLRDIRNDGLYYKSEYKDDHWVVIYGYKEGEYWEIFDSYDNFRKKIDWNYSFEFAKRYHLKKIIKVESSWEKLWKNIKNFFKYGYYIH